MSLKFVFLLVKRYYFHTNYDQIFFFSDKKNTAPHKKNIMLLFWMPPNN